MATTFRELNLSEPVQRALDEMGYETPTPVQTDAIPPLLAGRDIVAQAPTGTGKTAAFGIALAERTKRGGGTQALVLVPTRELCEQVAGELTRITKYTGQRVLKIYGGVAYNPQFDGLERGDEIVVGTPGRVIDHIKRGSFKTTRLSILCLDEADRMLDMGFMEDMDFIIERIPRGSHNLLFSATIPHEIEELAERIFRNPARMRAQGGKFKGKREEVVMEVGHRNKPWALHRVLESEDPDLAFIFCRTKATAQRLADLLKRHHYKCSAMHGDMTQAARQRVMDRVREGKVRVVVATDVLARGIDVPECDLVVNYDPPEEPEDYTHRVGRTARIGKVGKAVTLASRGDSRTLVEIEGHAGAQLTRVEVPDREGGKDRITRVHDWGEFADARGMVQFRLDGFDEKAGRMRIFWDLVKKTGFHEHDLGHVRLQDGTFRVQVPKEMAGKFQSVVRKKGVLGTRVQVEAELPAEDEDV